MALHVKTPKDQDLRVTEQPREGSRDRGYQGMKAGRGAGDRPQHWQPFHLAADSSPGQWAKEGDGVSGFTFAQESCSLAGSRCPHSSEFQKLCWVPSLLE